MKLFNRILALFTAFAMFAIMALVASPVVQAAQIPYQGENTPGLATPAFNVFTGTPSVGDESDFLRGKVETASGYVNNVEDACATGTRFSLRVYVHNAAADNLNNGGNGPGVAKDTKVRVALPNATASKFDVASVITASNASSVSDGMTIDCKGKNVDLKYVTGTAKQFVKVVTEGPNVHAGGTTALADTIVTTGALVGTDTPNGDVWGCWDQRVWVTLVVEVTEKPVVVVPQDAACTAIGNIIKTGNTVKVEGITPAVSGGATVVSYTIDWGDGTKTENFTSFPVSHTYTNLNNTITAYVNAKVNGETKQLTSANCTRAANFTKPTPTPTVLPSTGPGEVAGLFAATSALGAAAHSYITRRRNS